MEQVTSAMRNLLRLILLPSLLSSLPLFSEELKKQEPVAEINSFQACLEAGNPILPTTPPSCKTKDGKIFEKKPKRKKVESKKLCEDLCGNGKCEQIVCMAIGCPCPETKETCPQDCGD